MLCFVRVTLVLVTLFSKRNQYRIVKIQGEAQHFKTFLKKKHGLFRGMYNRKLRMILVQYSVEPVFYSILVNRLFLAYYLTRNIISFLSKIDGNSHCFKWKEYGVININNSVGKGSL